jgi:hypothetical protein
MVKTDAIYTQKKRRIQTTSSINVSNITETNNMCPIYNIIYNSWDNLKLLNEIHTTFNHYKYSLFIPLLSIVINTCTQYINFGLLKIGYNYIVDRSDYVYSNIIGPPIDKLNIKVSNIKFVITAKNNEIIYNIISSGNDVNIICSFKKGIVENKSFLKQCIYTAYNDLMN